MSIYINNYAIKKYEKEVKHVYQGMAKGLRDTVRVKDAKGAKSVEFKLMGKGTASQRSSMHTPLPVMNVNHTPKTATVTNWTASEWTDIFFNEQVDFDERQELAQTITLALERRLEQIIIDVLDGSGSSLTVADDVGGSADNLHLAHVKDAKRQLGAGGVPKTDLTLICHENGLHHFMDNTVVTSSDYTNKQVNIEGDLDYYYGFKFKSLEDRDEGGLPVPSANHRTSYAFHKWAVGLAINMDIRIETNYVPDHGAFLTTGFMSAGGVAVDPGGIVIITTDES